MKTIEELKEILISEIRKTNAYKKMVARPFFDGEHSWFSESCEQIELSWEEKIKLTSEFTNEDWKNCRCFLEEEIKLVKRQGYTNNNHAEFKEIPIVENIEELKKVSPSLKYDIEQIEKENWGKIDFKEFVDNYPI